MASTLLPSGTQRVIRTLSLFAVWRVGLTLGWLVNSAILQCNVQLQCASDRPFPRFGDLFISSYPVPPCPLLSPLVTTKFSVVTASHHQLSCVDRWCQSHRAVLVIQLFSCLCTPELSNTRSARSAVGCAQRSEESDQGRHLSKRSFGVLGT